MVKKVAIIQARLSSTRLPAKVLHDLYGKTMLERVIDQVKAAKLVDEVWVATSDGHDDDLIELVCKKVKIPVYRGSLAHVLERFYKVMRLTGADLLVRVTGDNPLTEPAFIDEGLSIIEEKRLDYVQFVDIPYGSGAEIFTKHALEESYARASTDEHKEHVTLYIRDHTERFKQMQVKPPLKWRRPDIRVTVDTLEDYVAMYKFFAAADGDYSLDEFMNWKK